MCIFQANHLSLWKDWTGWNFNRPTLSLEICNSTWLIWQRLLRIKEEFPLQHFNNASAASLRWKGPRWNNDFDTNLPKVATQKWYDWHVMEYTVPKSNMSLEYKSETQDKRQLCTEGIVEILLEDIFGRIVFRIFLKGTCRISIYRVHRD